METSLKVNFLRIATIACALVGTLVSAGAAAQTYPNKPIRLVVPYAAGGGSDVFARTVAPAMAADLGQTIYIENKPGAATAIGADQVAKSAPDGYNVLLGDTATYAVNPHLYSKLAYDPQKDLAPISLTARFALILVVNEAVPAKSVAELVALAKKQPMTYGTPGTGSPHHLAMELFRQRAGIALTNVPYRGSAPATNDLLGGVIPLMFLDLASAAQHIKAGKIRALAISSPTRLPEWKDVPTLAESGFAGYEAWAWQGFSVPANTPAAIVDRLNAAYRKAAADPANRQRVTDQGGELLTSTPEEMRSYIRSEGAKWARLIQEANIKVD